MHCLINCAQGTSLKRVAGATSQPEFTLWRVPRAWADLPPLDNANTILWLLLLLLTKAFPWLLAASTLNRKASCFRLMETPTQFKLFRVHVSYTAVGCLFTPSDSAVFLLFYRGVDKSLALPTSWCILFDGENISFDASLVIYTNSTNIPPIMIINRIYETQNLLSL
jgi:hypothetical protein